MNADSRRAMSRTHPQQGEHGGGNHYVLLLVMAVLSYVAMYILMYAMVDRWENVYANWNQAYMAALMAAPMIIIEIAVMGAMYRNRTLNVAIVAASVLLLALAWFAIRNQWGISDRQFLLSMIPHHSGALLMCREASITEPDIQELCKTIISGQEAEIDQMKAKLNSMK